MNDEARWREADAIFDRLMDLAPGERQAVLATLAPSSGVRERVDRLLAAHQARGPLDRASPPLSRQAPAQLGDWRLGVEIGRGGMAVVYRGERERGGGTQVAAIKVLTVAALVGHGRERFLREQGILARLRHPCIASLLDAGTAADGTPWLATELVDGEPADTWCTHRQLGAHAIVALVVAICEAVAYAHRHLIVHRDIKPANVLIDADGHVRLLDFGIARLLDGDTAATVTASRVLTPEYAAPEQFTGEAVTTATDVFGLGALLYRLLTGRSPRADAAADIEIPLPSRAIRGNTDLPASARVELLRAVSGDLDRVLMRALAREPDRRYADANALSEDLSRWLHGRPVQAVTPTRAYRLRRFVGRHRAGFAATALVLIALAAGAAATLWQARQTVREAARVAATNAFLVDLIGAGDLAAAGSQRTTLRSVLRQALAAFERNDPRVVSLNRDLLPLLARALFSQEDYAAARRALDVAQRDAAHGASPSAEAALEIARLRAELAMLDRDLPAAAAELDRAQQQLAAIPPAAVADTTALIITRARYLRQTHHEREAQASLHGLIAALRRRYGAADARTYAARTLLLDTQNFVNDTAAAIAYGVPLLADAKRDLHADHPLLPRIEYLLAAAYAARVQDGDSTALGEQARYARASLDAATRIFGEDSAAAADAHSALGAAAAYGGDLDEAEREFGAAHALEVRLYGSHSLRAANSLSDLAFVAYRRGNADLARSRLADAIASSEQARSPDPQNLGRMWRTLGVMHQRASQMAAAETAYRHSLDYFTAAGAAGRSDWVDAGIGLARVLRARNALEDGAQVAAAAAAAARALGPAQLKNRRDALAIVIDLRSRLGQAAASQAAASELASLPAPVALGDQRTERTTRHLR